MTQISPPAYTHIGQAPAIYQADAIYRLITVNRAGLPFTMIVAIAAILGLWPYVDSTLLLAAFFAWILTIPVGLASVFRWYMAKPVVAVADAPRWGRRITLIMSCEGVIIGLLSLLLYSTESAAPQLIFAMGNLGRVAGSIFTTSWWPSAFYGNTYTSIVLTVVGLLLRDPDVYWPVSIALLGFLGGIHMVMRKAHAIAVQTIALNFEKQDLIEQLNQEKAIAENANRDKSRFLAAASHDLRQPIHALTLFVAALKNRLGNTALSNMVEQINRCTGALESLLQTLLDISKIDANTVVPYPCDFHIQAIVERLRAEHELQAEAAGLALKADCPPLALHSDPALLEAILRNLLSNALRYTRTGSVTLFAAARGEEVIVGVRDTGIGIAPDKQAIIFDEFVQLANPERDRAKGLGLGLAIVQRLSRLLGSQIVVESVLDQGSTFYLALPAGNSAAVRVETPAPPVSNLLADSIVIVIDDEPDIRRGMQTLLEDWGCRVYAAEDAASAIQQLDSCGLVPDLAVSDFRLGNGATGLDAVQQIKARFADTACAIITGDTAREPLNAVQASGLPLLHKPVQPAKLRALLLSLRRNQIQE